MGLNWDKNLELQQAFTGQNNRNQTTWYRHRTIRVGIHSKTRVTSNFLSLDGTKLLY